MITGSIRIGDLIYMEKFDETLEIVGISSEPDEQPVIYYWGSKYPKEVGTKKCRCAAAWILFKYGHKIGEV